jgi:hypothetical protein
MSRWLTSSLQLGLLLAAFQMMPSAQLRAEVAGTAGHEHLTEVGCVDVPPGETRPEFGCFNVGVVTGLHFSQPSVYWHLHSFPNREAAEAAKSATGIVVEEDGQVWLSEFGRRNSAPRGGDAIAVVGPLVIHDSAQQRGIPSNWKPPGACSR